MSANAPILITGCQRSGTTLLQLILDSHREITRVDEDAFDLAELPRYLESPDWGPRVCFKLPRFAGRPDFIEALEGVRVLWSIRDPRDVVASMLALELPLNRFVKLAWVDHPAGAEVEIAEARRCLEGRLEAEVTRELEAWDRAQGKRAATRSRLERVRAGALCWRLKNELPRLYSERGIDYHPVRYEELVAQPRQTMAELLDFLRTDWDDAVLCHHRSHSGIETGDTRGDRPIDAGNTGKWRSALDAAELAVLSEVCEPLASEWGYDLDRIDDARQVLPEERTEPSRASDQEAEVQFDAAEVAMRRTLAADLNNADAHFDLGNLLRQQGRIGEAIRAFQRATRLRPEFASAYNNLGSLFQIEGRIDAAMACIRRSLEIDPSSADAHFNLGSLLEGEGVLEKARASYDASIDRGPALGAQVHIHYAHLCRMLCDWTDSRGSAACVDEQVRLHLGSGVKRGLPPLTLNVFGIDGPLRLAVARQQAEGLEAQTREARSRAAFVHRSKRRERLRIGYVSPDLRGHAVGTLVHRMFEHHDRERFEVHAYSIVSVDDSFSRSIRAGCDAFNDVSKESPEQTAQRVHGDGIDVLVDLGGYTTYTRTAILAMRPAPVQLHYLGYLDTMGADFLPYLVADERVVTREMEAHYSEAIVRLPGCFAVASPLPISEAPQTREQHDLPEDAFVFCCMNSLHKLDPVTFDAWMQVLARVPDALLWCYEGPTEAGRENLRLAARRAGVAPERLRFARKLPLPEYLARYRVADLFLDTFSYNAGATAIGALQAGLPVLTHPGETFFSRMGASLVEAAGLPELVAQSQAAYVDRAVELATGDALPALRSRLAANFQHAPLFDLEDRVRAIERSYEELWRRHERGIAPASFSVE